MTIFYPLTRREVEIEHQNGRHQEPMLYTGIYWGVSKCPFCERKIERQQRAAERAFEFELRLSAERREEELLSRLEQVYALAE